MKTDYELYVQAEFAATQQLLVNVLTTVSTLVKAAGMNRDDFLALQLESGLNNLDLVNFWDVPEEQKETILEKAKARYAALVSSAAR